MIFNKVFFELTEDEESAIARRLLRKGGEYLKKARSKAGEFIKKEVLPTTGQAIKKTIVTAPTVVGGAALLKARSTETEHKAKKEFAATVTGTDLYERLNSLNKKYQQLQSNRSKYPDAIYRTMAERLEAKIVSTRQEISKKQQAYKF